MTPDVTLERLAQRRIVAIVRASSAERAAGAAEALARGGIRAIEIAFTTPGAPAAIRAARRLDGVVVGAGTVRTLADLEAAVDAGAAFVASPATSIDVLLAARNAEILAVPGVLTPSEVERALPLAPLLKLFPAGIGGPPLLRALRGPFPAVRFMPTGGVVRDNVREWLAAGAFAVGAGTDLCPTDAVERGDLEAITARAVEYVEAVRA